MIQEARELTEGEVSSKQQAILGAISGGLKKAGAKLNFGTDHGIPVVMAKKWLGGSDIAVGVLAGDADALVQLQGPFVWQPKGEISPDVQDWLDQAEGKILAALKSKDPGSKWQATGGHTLEFEGQVKDVKTAVDAITAAFSGLRAG